MTRHIENVSNAILAYLIEPLLGVALDEEEDVVPKSEEVRE